MCWASDADANANQASGDQRRSDSTRRAAEGHGEGVGIRLADLARQMGGTTNPIHLEPDLGLVRQLPNHTMLDSTSASSMDISAETTLPASTTL